MNANKVIEELARKYPGKTIIKNIEDNPSEILCEVDPSSEHTSYSLAVSVIDKSIPHVHKKSKEVYKVVKGSLALLVDEKKHQLTEGQEFTIHTGQVHWAEGTETWVECRSEPGWQFEDHLEVNEKHSLYNSSNIPTQTWITPKVRAKTSTVEGNGMFALSTIKKGEVVIVWGGNYIGKQGAKKAETQGKLVMQWDDNLYSVEERGDDPSYYINHSCEPNLWMLDVVTLVAKRVIKKGEELTADYSMWEADENYVSKWNCNCGSTKCRKKITGKDWRLSELQERYRGHFSPLINKRIRQTGN